MACPPESDVQERPYQPPKVAPGLREHAQRILILPQKMCGYRT
jgi:hypothetical protein